MPSRLVSSVMCITRMKFYQRDLDMERYSLHIIPWSSPTSVFIHHQPHLHLIRMLSLIWRLSPKACKFLSSSCDFFFFSSKLLLNGGCHSKWSYVLLTSLISFSSIWVTSVSLSKLWFTYRELLMIDTTYWTALFCILYSFDISSNKFPNLKMNI